MDSLVVQEFSRTLFNLKPDIALWTFHVIFESDLRSHIIQSSKDMAVPSLVSDYLPPPEYWKYRANNTNGRPKVTIPTLPTRHIKCDNEVQINNNVHTYMYFAKEENYVATSRCSSGFLVT